MKGLTIILSVWVLLLSAVPCCAAWQVNKSTSQLTAQPTSGCPDEDCADDHHSPCSPFCSCQTCPGFIVPVSLTLPVVAGQLRQISRVGFRPLLPVSVALPIWQPPQFV